MKKIFYSEIAYIVGLMLIALGAAFATASDLGVSMVVAPAYLLHLKVSEYWPFFTFGKAEYVLQAILLILMVIAIRKFKVAYLFSFVTAVIYGTILDGFIFLTSKINCDSLAVQIILFTIGMLSCAVGVAIIIHTYIAPEVYELIVKEVPKKFNLKLSVFKTLFDISFLIIATVMSLIFYKEIRGVGVRTIVCALLNGFLIGKISAFLERKFEFKDRFNLRKYFE